MSKPANCDICGQPVSHTEFTARCGKFMHVSCLFRECERLQTIVDRLPKTADGVPVVPGQFIYSSDGRAMMMLTYAQHEGHMAYPDVCYSTREAAEAARGDA